VVGWNRIGRRVAVGFVAPCPRLGSLAAPFGIIISARPGDGLPKDKTFQDQPVLNLESLGFEHELWTDETHMFRAKLKLRIPGILDLTQSFGNNAHVSRIKINVVWSVSPLLFRKIT
jgi:hypothetical protein